MKGLRLALVLTVVVAASGPALAEEKVFHLKNGRRVRGDLVEETTTAYVVKTAGGRVTLVRDDVTRIEAAETPKGVLEPERRKPSREGSEPSSPTRPERPVREARPAPVKIDAEVAEKVREIAKAVLTNTISREVEDRVEEGLVALGAEGALATIDLLIRDSSYHSRPGTGALIASVRRTADARICPLLGELLAKGTTAGVRRYALALIGQFRCLESVPAVVELFADDALGANAADATLPCFTPPATEEKQEARKGYAAAVAAVTSSVLSRNPLVAGRASKAFSELVSRATSDDIVTRIKHDAVRAPAAREAFLLGLLARASRGIPPGPEVLRYVSGWLSDVEPPVRVAAARLMGRVKDRDNVLNLIEMLADSDEPCRRAALGALREISGVSAFTTADEWRTWWKANKK